MANPLTCFWYPGRPVHSSRQSEDEHEYQFDLETRQVMLVIPRPGLEPAKVLFTSQFETVDHYFARLAGSPTCLLALVMNNPLPKATLADLLSPDTRKTFLSVCENIEKAITRTCTDKGDPCLAGGCACEGGVCLNALLETGDLYWKKCADVWLEFFVNPNHRIDIWKR